MRKPSDSGESALARLEAVDRPPINLLILDLVMPDLDGMGVLARMRQRDIAVPAIVQTAHGSIEAVISAMRAGAIDFVVKPVGAERLQVSIRNALRVDALEDELRRATRRSAGELSFRDIVSRAESMARTIRLAERAAKSNIPVLIEGESGVGKELMARAIQGGSDRRGKASSPSIAARFPRRSSNPSCSGMRKAHSPARPISTWASSPRRTAARCSSTRSANSPPKRKSSCCARCRRAKSIRSARGGR